MEHMFPVRGHMGYALFRPTGPVAYEWPTRPMTPSIKPSSAGQHNPPLFFFSCKHSQRERAKRVIWGPVGGHGRGQCYSKAGSGPHSRRPIRGCCSQKITDTHTQMCTCTYSIIYPCMWTQQTHAHFWCRYKHTSHILRQGAACHVCPSISLSQASPCTLNFSALLPSASHPRTANTQTCTRTYTYTPTTHTFNLALYGELLGPPLNLFHR